MPRDQTKTRAVQPRGSTVVEVYRGDPALGLFAIHDAAAYERYTGLSSDQINKKDAITQKKFFVRRRIIR